MPTDYWLTDWLTDLLTDCKYKVGNPLSNWLDLNSIELTYCTNVLSSPIFNPLSNQTKPDEWMNKDIANQMMSQLVYWVSYTDWKTERFARVAIRNNKCLVGKDFEPC